MQRHAPQPPNYPGTKTQIPPPRYSGAETLTTPPGYPGADTRTPPPRYPEADTWTPPPRYPGAETQTPPPRPHTNQKHEKCTSNASFVLSGDFLPNSFRVQSTQIAKDVINYVCRHEQAAMPPSKQAIIMRNLVDDALKDRLNMMCHLVMKLDVKSRDELHLVDNIATSMFDDEMVNWGRIVTLCAFCGYLARYCEEHYIPDCSDEIAKILSNIIVNRLGLWIVANGGWNAFEQQFPAVCIWENSGLWKGVAIIALLIGAVIAFGSSVKFMNSS